MCAAFAALLNMKIAIDPARTAELIGNSVLNLILFPTEKCNFRCIYCYEDFELGKMPADVIDGVKNLISKRSENLEVLELSWFGGEPLLAIDVITEICEHAKSMEAKFPQMKYSSNITTNGYFLSLSNFKKLVYLGINFFQVTLDGDRELHDRTTQKDCFDRIWGNLLEFKGSSLDATIELRVHYSPETFDLLPNLIAKINDSFSGDSRFKVYFKSIEHYGSVNDHNIGLFDIESSRVAKSALESQLANPSMVYTVPYSSQFICYAAKGTSFGIRADGTIVKCTVALKEERNSIGKILKDGSMIIDATKMRRWMGGLVTGDPKMLQCPNSQMRSYKPIKFVRM